jgi:xanthine dehydrogenase accessory factor
VKEFRDIIEVYDKIDKLKTRLAMATVIDVKGSSYRRIGARMLIQDNGIWTGGISGGCIEGDALKKAHLAISGKKSIKVTYDTSKENEEQIGVSLGCSGVIDVLVTPINPKDNDNPVEQLRNCITSREPKVLVNVIESDDAKISSGEMFCYSNSQVENQNFGHFNKDSISEVLKSEKSEIKVLGSSKILFEFVPPPLQIVIMGGNYDVYPLLKIVNSLGWHSIVIANTRRLDKKIHDLADEVLPDFDDVKVDKYTAGILMSHDYNQDLKNLKKVLKTDLPFIGILGPASRKHDLMEELSVYINTDDKERIFGPVGLDIGASQPEEIAISIVSEILSVMRKRPGTSLKNKKGPIYPR